MSSCSVTQSRMMKSKVDSPAERTFSGELKTDLKDLNLATKDNEIGLLARNREAEINLN